MEVADPEVVFCLMKIASNNSRIAGLKSGAIKLLVTGLKCSPSMKISPKPVKRKKIEERTPDYKCKIDRVKIPFQTSTRSLSEYFEMIHSHLTSQILILVGWRIWVVQSDFSGKKQRNPVEPEPTLLKSTGCTISVFGRTLLTPM